METDNAFAALDGAAEGTTSQSIPSRRVNMNAPKSKPPPIFINGVDINDTINKLTTEGIDKNLFTTYVNKTNLNIISKNHETYDKIKVCFKNKVEFYTYTKKEDKPITILLKNIAGIFTEQLIQSEINYLNLLQVKLIKVKKLPMKSEQEKKHFIVQITPDSLLKNLVQVRRLCCQKIKWEKLRKPKIIQCTRCQRVGHSASTCDMFYRCVKCSENHAKGECKITKEDDKTKLTCANCGQKGHPANYQGCPYLKIANQERQHSLNKFQRPRNTNRPPVDRFIQPGLLYTIAIRNNIKHEVISHPSSVNNSTIEFTIIKLLSSEDQNGKTFIVSIYATPDNKKTVDYDSDHRALLFTVQLRSTIQLKQVIKKFNFKATNWSQFSKFLAKNCNPSPPDDRNLSNTEIDYLVETTTKSIREAIVSTVPQFKKQDSIFKYLNSRIKKLQNNKSSLITKLHILQRQHQSHLHQQEIQNIKQMIKLIKEELRKEFSKSITCYWSNQLRQVNHRDPNAFFPKINRMLRPKQNIEIANQIIKSDSDLITNKTVQMNNAFSDPITSTTTITNPIDKLNVIGKHYQKINSPRYLNIGTSLKNIIDHTVNNMKKKLENSEKTGTSRGSSADRFGKAFADDFIAYLIGTNPRKQIADFQLQTEHPDTKELINVPHKNEVKYLGFHFDYLMKLNSHVIKQLDKAKKAFQANSRIFYSKHLYPKAKIICYQLLIRPILTYGSPVWWNINAATMEKMRAFERKCLRACCSQYRSRESNFKKFISNKQLYDLANIPRIDNFIIKLNRDYFCNLRDIENSDLKLINDMDPIKGEKYNSSGYIFPNMFIHYDRLDLIQNHNNIPIVYHYTRRSNDKRINYTADCFTNKRHNFNYSTDIPLRDQLDFTRLNDKYWWLAEETPHRKHLRKRLKTGWTAIY
ncbi:Similar to ORF1: Nucleic-acid-binding protein from transposon X-element (Drosophila melanogaster) [Cotesia congregata]|uniref:Similar to ORF1: Nucleic-acid-binding protein from transposon X-element (Drosophila melanogaster) n=1 Tax=Cotesia congregata TaxID=51543 RepID=A0A8J2H2Z7_COTCN|nr:Similar to ORF1: Nucleic-acid-binding protein from transposon X-element (Drosophila melanogaster) [Cotesia congregata]